MEDRKRLLEEAGILKMDNDNKFTILPFGILIWNKIVDYLKDKFIGLGYSEVYSTCLKEYVKSTVYLPSEHFSLKYSNSDIEFTSYGKYDNEIEGARNTTIDVLEIYNQLGKDLLAIPFFSGKDVYDENKNILTTYLGEKNIESSFLGKENDEYLISSKISSDILNTLIDIHKDEKGLVIPPKIAPYQIVIIPLKPNEKGVLKECRRLYEDLSLYGFRVYLNEKNIPSNDKKEAAMVCGIPLIMEFGPRDLERNVVEITYRDNLVQEQISNDHRLEIVVDRIIKSMQKRMYNKVLEQNIKKQKKVLNLGDLHNNKCDEINKVMWCGDLKCLDSLKECISFIPFSQQNHSSECLFCYKKSKHLISIIKK